MDRLLIGIAIALLGALGLALVGTAQAPLHLAAATGVALAVGIGAELLVRTHPLYHARNAAVFGCTWWIAPALFTLAALLLTLTPLGEQGGWPGKGLALMLLVLVAATQYGEIWGGRGGRGARFALSLATYLSAFALFTLIIELTRQPALSALGVAVVSGLLAVPVIRSPQIDRRRVALLGATTGAVVGQLVLAVQFWGVTSIVAGAFLLLVFYVLSGGLQSAVEGHAVPRVLLEYAVVGVLGFVLIVGATLRF